MVDVAAGLCKVKGDVVAGWSKVTGDVAESSSKVLGDVAEGPMVDVPLLIDGIESTGEVGDSWSVDCRQYSIK